MEENNLKFSEMLEMQKRLQYAMFKHELPNDSVEDFKYSMLALIGELGEVLEADKRWKSIRGGHYDRAAKLDELVDCMAFMLNMVLFSGFDYDEFCKAFEKKNRRNFYRFYNEEKEKQNANSDC